MKSRVAFYVILAILGLAAAAMLVPVFVPVAAAAILGYLLLPVYDWLGKRLSSPGARAALLVAAVLIVLALPVLLVVVQVADDVPRAFESADLGKAIEKINAHADALFGRHIPAEKLAAYLASVREAILSATPRLLGAVGSTALSLFIMIYTLYYVLLDGRTVWRNLLAILPLEDEVKPLLTEDLRQTVTGVLYGQLVTAAAQAALAAIGYLIFHIPHVLFWTFLTLLVSMIPIAGSALIWAPLAISRLAAGDKFGGIGLLIYGAVLVMNIDNVIRPRLIAGRTRLHPVTALLGVVGGVQLFGVIGFVLGPVLLSLVVAMLRFHRAVTLRPSQASAISE